LHSWSIPARLLFDAPVFAERDDQLQLCFAGGVMLAVAILGERLSVGLLDGMALVAVGLALIARR
jgi:drug/metabolite transporter (DMT)-like permease